MGDTGHINHEDGGTNQQETQGHIPENRDDFLQQIFVRNSSRVQLHLSGLVGTASHPDMQQIRIIGFFFENRLHWQFEAEKNTTNRCFRLHTYLRTNKILIHNFLYIYLTNGGKI